MNLSTQPTEIVIEDIFLLAVPSTETDFDPAEEEERDQAAKASKLENAELLHIRGEAETESSAPLEMPHGIHSHQYL